MNQKLSTNAQSQAFERHRRKCVVCRHPDREAIEEEFIHWRGPWELSRQYRIGDYRSLYRHARATGILLQRRENFHSALDSIVESAEEAKVTGDCVIRAIRAYSCIDSRGRWTDPPTQVNFSSAPPPCPAVSAAQPSPIIDIAEPVSAAELPSDGESDSDSGEGFTLDPELVAELTRKIDSPAPDDPSVRDVNLIYRNAIRTGLNALKTGAETDF